RPSERPLDAKKQGALVDRLGEEAARTPLERGCPQMLLWKCREEYDGNPGLYIGQTALQLDAAQPGHTHVGDHARGHANLLRLQELLGRRERRSRIAVRLHEVRRRLADRPVVVHNRDQGKSGQAAFLGRSRASRRQIGTVGERGKLYPGLPSHHCGRSRPRVCAILIRSASDLAPSFRMALPRCTLTVISAKPSLPAICLFIRPAPASPITSCSRRVKDSKRASNS